MKDVPENELFSAYLDGELTAAEQAQVEELLERSPRARQLLDELRALSATLQSLPSRTLDEDLGEKVLRTAERRILSERPAGVSGAPPTVAEPLAAPAEPSRLRRMLSARSLSWSIVAVAAALLIMALEHGGVEEAGDDREVAKAPAAAADRAREDGEGLAMRAAEPPPGESPAGFAAATGTDREMTAVEAQASLPAEPPATPAAEKLPARKGLVKREAVADRADLAPASPPPAAPSAPAVAEGGGPSGRAESVAEPMPAAEPVSAAKPEPAHLAAKTARRVLAEKVDRAGGAGGGAGAGRIPSGETRGDAFGSAALSAPNKATADAPVMLVQCDVTPEAMRTRAFDRLLAAQGIQWDGAKAKKEAAQFRQQADQLRDMDPTQETPEETEEDGVDAGPKDAPAMAGPVELIYVEAGPDEIQATLASLSARPELFVTVSINPAPGMASQRGLARYNRTRRTSGDGAAPDAMRPAKAGMLSAKPAAPEPFAAQATADSTTAPQGARGAGAAPVDSFDQAATAEAMPKQFGAAAPSSPFQGRAQRLALPGAGERRVPLRLKAGNAESNRRPGKDGAGLGQAMQEAEPPQATVGAEPEWANATEAGATRRAPAPPAPGQPAEKPERAQAEATDPAVAADAVVEEAAERERPEGISSGAVEEQALSPESAEQPVTRELAKRPGQPGMYRVLFVLRVADPEGGSSGAAGAEATVSEEAAATVEPVEPPAPAPAASTTP